MKSLNESIKNILTEKNNVLAHKSPEQLRGHSFFKEAEEAAPEVDSAAADATEAEAPEAEEEAPEPKKATKGEKPKYVAQCAQDGEETIVLVSKSELEQLIHENGTKCIVKLYELGKETKVPEVKVKV